MPEQRIRYVESYPDKIDKTFQNMEKYYNFYNQRFKEVTEKLDFFNPASEYKYYDWKYNKFKLNKDGTPRKYFNPTHLHTPKARKQQEKKFKEYQEKLKKERDLKRKQKEELDITTYNLAIAILLEHRIDLNRLDIKIKK